jgi:hypothetical protein
MPKSKKTKKVAKQPQTIDISSKRYEAWMMEFSKRFADELTTTILNEVIKTKQARSKK